MAVRVLLADVNNIYRSRFLEAVKGKSQFNITAVSSKDELSKALSLSQYDALLLDPALYSETVAYDKARLVLLLADEEKTPGLDAAAGFGKVQKYQRVSDITGYILKKLAELPAEAAQTYAVFSAQGGAGVTTVAAVLALQYAKIGKRVLYANMEAIDSTPLFYAGKDEGLSALVLKDAVNISELVNNGLYDVIVIDCQYTGDEKQAAMLEKADALILTADLGETGPWKLERFISEDPIFQTCQAKIKLVYNKKPARWRAPEYGLPLLGEIPPFPAAAFREMIENIRNAGLIRLPG